jgi:hypothetical protein
MEKISFKSLFYFAEEDPGHGSEDIKKNVVSAVVILSCFLTGLHNKGVKWLLCPFLL